MTGSNVASFALLPVPGCHCAACVRLARALGRWTRAVEMHSGTMRSPATWQAVSRALAAVDRAHEGQLPQPRKDQP